MSSDTESEIKTQTPPGAEQEQIEKPKDDSFNLKAPPKDKMTTVRGREFHFGKPALKHRKVITKCLQLMSSQGADYDAIVKCAKARNMSVEDFVRLPEEDFTIEEKKAILKNNDGQSTTEMAEMMNDMLAEVLYATIKKAPFTFSSLDEFEEKMDDYAEALELFANSIRWIAVSAQDLAKIDRKNL